jgi:hypothetical protein
MRAASERVTGHPATHPRAVDIGVAMIAGVPLGTPQPASGGEVVRRGHGSFLTQRGRRVEAWPFDRLRGNVLWLRGSGSWPNEIMTAMSTRSMRAYVQKAPGEGGVQEVPAPVAAPGEVVVDKERVGVCGTDMESSPAIWPTFSRGNPHTRCSSGMSGRARSPASGAESLLDLGCGTGVPTARQLVDGGCEVTGVDIRR